jgi:hypothetical protein
MKQTELNGTELNVTELVNRTIMNAKWLLLDITLTLAHIVAFVSSFYNRSGDVPPSELFTHQFKWHPQIMFLVSLSPLKSLSTPQNRS